MVTAHRNATDQPDSANVSFEVSVLRRSVVAVSIRTCVRFHVRMLSIVHDEVTLPRCAEIAVFAAVRPLSRVNPAMHGEMPMLSRAIVAFIASKGLGSRVLTHVPGQMMFPRKSVSKTVSKRIEMHDASE